MDVSPDNVPRRSENVVFRKIGEEYILVPLAGSAADVESIYNLNETGAAIWEKIDGKRTLAEIISEIESEYDGEGRGVEEDVNSFVKEMVDAGLLQV